MLSASVPPRARATSETQRAEIRDEEAGNGSKSQGSTENTEFHVLRGIERFRWALAGLRGKLVQAAVDIICCCLRQFFVCSPSNRQVSASVAGYGLLA